MRTIILLVTFLYLTQISNAQRPRTILNEMGLKGNVKELIEYTYRGELNEVSIDTLHNPSKRIARFDENGNETDESIEGGALAGKFLFDYTQNQTIIKNQFDPDGKLRDKYIYKYDRNGNKIEFDTYYGVGLNSLIKVTYKYDENNRLIEENQANEQFKFFSRTVYLYDKKGEIFEEHVYHEKNGDKFSKTLKLYDNAGNIVSTESFNSDGIFLMGYFNQDSDFDANGNWLKEVSEDKGHSTMQGDYLFKNITKRVIQYY